MEITKNNCMDLILKKFPGFSADLALYKSEFEETTIWGAMCEFSTYISNLLIDSNTKSSEIREIFSFMEDLLSRGDEDVDNAICTCFLENILNVTPEKIDPKRFVEFLGPKSREYCIAWDEFTGVMTEGLH